jgi:hypothetical protein
MLQRETAMNDNIDILSERPCERLAEVYKYE